MRGYVFSAGETGPFVDGAALRRTYDTVGRLQRVRKGQDPFFYPSPRRTVNLCGGPPRTAALLFIRGLFTAPDHFYKPSLRYAPGSLPAARASPLPGPELVGTGCQRALFPAQDQGRAARLPLPGMIKRHTARRTPGTALAAAPVPLYTGPFGHTRMRRMRTNHS